MKELFILSLSVLFFRQSWPCPLFWANLHVAIENKYTFATTPLVIGLKLTLALSPSSPPGSLCGIGKGGLLGGRRAPRTRRAKFASALLSSPPLRRARETLRQRGQCL